MNSNEEKVPYVITIQTSSAFVDAGTSSSVRLQFFGKNGDSTDQFDLKNGFLTDNFKRGEKNLFLINLKNVGFPDLIKIELNKSCFIPEKNKWFCDYIEIGIQGLIEKIRYPIYDWIVHDMEGIAPAKATIPQKITNPLVKEARKQEIARSKKLIEWIPEPKKDDLYYGLPRFVNASEYSELPDILKMDEVRGKDYRNDQLEILEKVLQNIIQDITHPHMSSLDEYKELYKDMDLPLDNPAYIDDWKKDETMGRQTLTGISPLAISKCTEIPSYFSVKNDDVKDFLDKGKTLQEEMKAGKVYICDYVPLLKDVKRNANLIYANCMGLFYVKDGEFLPIAIQLVENNPEYLFTPKNSEFGWLLAKMYFRCAAASAHEWVYHFLYTHLMIGPFCVALFRCLPKAHPVYKLLRPHIQNCSAKNENVRKHLLDPTSLLNKAISLSALDTARAFFKTCKLDDIVIPKRLKKQGTDDQSQLPGFYYRDDALKLWHIMEEYVKNIICLCYKSDQDVVEDYELQDWIRNVSEEGFDWFRREEKNFPNKIASIEQLIEICVTVMFTSTAQHAAVNPGSFETYKFIPNSPTCMNKEPPRKIDKVDESLVLESLPNRFQAVAIIAVTHALSGFSKEDVFIGQFLPYNYFNEDDIFAIQLEYNKKLQELEAELIERNEKLGLQRKYDFLLPGRIPIELAT